MRAATNLRLDKLTRLRALKEQVALTERVQAQSIANKAVAEVTNLRNRLNDSALEARDNRDADFAALVGQKGVNVHSVISVFESADLRAQNLQNLQSTLIQAEGSARLHIAEFDRLATVHNHIRARVNGLEKLVSELQATERRRSDLSQDDAIELEMTGATPLC